MRRFISFLAALALVAVVAAPASANTVTVYKATVTSAGLVSLYGTVSCPEGVQFQIGGDVTQILNHKYVVNGQINGIDTFTCLAGTTPWSVQLTANSNKFSTGQAVVNLNLGGGGCTDPSQDPNTCPPGFGDSVQLLVKIVRK